MSICLLMNEREAKIIEAAIAVFSRYGVKRATMQDIASEAGIVRQTLYNAFPNKDEVLRAVIRLLADRALAAVEAESRETQALGQKLDILFDHLTVKPFVLLNNSHHAGDIVEGLNAAAKDEIAQAEERNIAAVEAILAPYEARIRAAGLTLRGLSELVQKSAAGFKYKAQTKTQLLELLRSLKTLVLTLLGET